MKSLTRLGAAEQRLTTVYRTISELLLYPEARDADRIALGLAELAGPSAIVDSVRAFCAAPRANNTDEYVAVLELTPPCPLYLGSYIFDEPPSCRGAAVSGRNAYMIEVAAAYRHFGFELGSGELADFLPAMVEFLAISLEYRDRDRIGLRPRFVEHYVQPGLPPMRRALAKYDSPYGLLIEALEAAVAEDRAMHAKDPIWAPPERVGKPPQPPIISFNANRRAASAGGSI